MTSESISRNLLKVGHIIFIANFGLAALLPADDRWKFLTHFAYPRIFGRLSYGGSP